MTEPMTAEKWVRKDWGARIRQEREARKVTQEQLAEAAHVSQPTISDIERGAYRSINPDLLVRIAVALDLEPAKFAPWPESILGLAKLERQAKAS